MESKRLKNGVTRIISSLNAIASVTVSWDAEKKLVVIANSYSMCPGFEIKYSEDYNVYHVYIVIKGRGDEEKVRTGYPLMVIDGDLSAVEFINMVQMLYRRRAGKHN